jgi:hypothetical protein
MEKVAPRDFAQNWMRCWPVSVREHDPVETVGRRRYERRGETVSHRNGHEPKTIKTTSGSMAPERPRVRDASKLGFESRILGTRLRSKTDSLSRRTGRVAGLSRSGRW